MSRTLNTSHPLYANLKSLICVEGGVLKDLVTPGRTFVVEAQCSYGSGTYGEHVLTAGAGYYPQGVRFSSAVSVNTGNSGETVFVVINNSPSFGGEPYLLDADSFALNVFASTFPRVVGGFGGSRPQGNEASVSLANTGAHSIIMSRPQGDVSSAADPKLYIDGTLAVQGTASYIFYATASNYWGFGGPGAGNSGNGSVSASFVWFAVFDKQLTAQETADLHASLGANNALSLINGGSVAGNASGAMAPFSMSSFLGYAWSGGGTPGFASGSMPSMSLISASMMATGGVAGVLQTDQIINNTGTVQSNTAVSWSWVPLGRIGSLAGKTSVDGTGTTDNNGRLNLSTLLQGSGILFIAIPGASAALDAVYYQAGTVA